MIFCVTNQVKCVENNSLGGAAAGSGLGFWLADIPDCDAQCKAKLAGEIAEGNATVSAGMANTAGIAILPGAAQAMWGLGAAANTGVRYFDGKDFSPVNASVAGWVNVVSMGHGLPGVVGWNAAGGALTNAINGDDPLTGAITNGAGSAFGYGMGQLAKVGVNAAGKYLTQGFDPKFHPNLLKYTEVKGQLGISKEMLPSKIPGAVGNVTSSISAEFSTDTADKSFKKAGDDENSPPK